MRPTSPGWTADYLTADRTWALSSPTVADAGHPRGFETRRIDRTGDAPLLLHASRGTLAGRRIRRDHGRHAGGRAGVASRVLATGHAGPAPGEGLQRVRARRQQHAQACASNPPANRGTYLRQGLTGGSNVRFGRGDRRFRHIARARDHRDVPRDAAESLRRSPPFPRPPACRIAGEGACTSKSRSRRGTGEQHRRWQAASNCGRPTSSVVRAIAE